MDTKQIEKIKKSFSDLYERLAYKKIQDQQKFLSKMFATDTTKGELDRLENNQLHKTKIIMSDTLNKLLLDTHCSNKPKFYSMMKDYEIDKSILHYAKNYYERKRAQLNKRIEKLDIKLEKENSWRT